MTTIAQPKSYCIQNPRFDLIYLSYGWIAVLAAFMVFKQYYGALILIVLAFNFIHRHYTFAPREQLSFLESFKKTVAIQRNILTGASGR